MISRKYFETSDTRSDAPLPVLDITLSCICEPRTFSSRTSDPSSLMNIQCFIVSLSQGSGYTQITRSRCVCRTRVSGVHRVAQGFPFQVDFSSCHCRVAIGNPPNSLCHWSSHNIHRVASFAPGAFPHNLAFVTACLPNPADWRSSDTQGQRQMWYSTLQALIGKLYVLSHFYSMYVVPVPVPISYLPPLYRFHRNSPPLFVGEQEQPPKYTSTLTVPSSHGIGTAHNTPEGHILELYSDYFERAEGAHR